MAETNANININANTSQALAAIKDLQRSLSTLYVNMSKGSAAAQASVAGYQQNLINSINATGQFTARLTTVKTSTEAFTNALEKNKLSLGQYFRYGAAASKRFGQTFKTEFATIDKVARERVKDLQTQYIKMGRDANGAMKAIAVRPTTLDLKNLGTQTAIAAQKQQLFNQLIKQGSTNLLNWGKNTQWAGRQLMVGFTIPLTLFATQAGRAFMQLEEQAIKFKRVYGDLFTTTAQTDQALADMRELANEFTKFGVAVEETMGLAAEVAQMGNTGAELQAQVREATRLAVLGGISQQDALNTTVSVTDAFAVSTDNLAQKINFLNAVENQTILSIDDFNEAVPKSGAVVKQLGGDVEDLAFFLTAMREGGINASQGANALKSSLARLVNPTTRAKEQLAGYGINVLGIVEENSGNLRETVLTLARELDRLDPLDKARAIETLFGKFQFARMSALFNNITNEGSQAQQVLQLINMEASELQQLASRELGRVEESAATQFRAAIERFQAALAPIGEQFLKLATPVIEWATDLLDRFNQLGEGGQRFVALLLGAIGGVAPVLLMVIGLTANLVANFIKGAASISQFFQRFRGQSQNLAEQTNYLNSEQLESAAIAASLNQTHQNLIQTFTIEAGAVDRLRAAYEKAAVAARGFRGPIVTDGGKMMKMPGYSKGKKVPGYKDGVVTVPGRKGEGDTQPAMLAPGEAVIPAKMAEKYGPLINAMIAGNIPGYKTGRGVPGSFVEDIVSKAPAKSQDSVRRLLLRDVAMLENAKEEVVQEFMEFVQGVANNTTRLTRTTLDTALKENRSLIEQYRAPRYLQQNKAQFSHIGERKEMTAQQVASSDMIKASRPTLKKDIDIISQAIPDKVIKLYHGLGLDITGSLNEQMGKAGAQIEALSADLSTRGIDAYRTAVTIGGGSFEEMAPALRQLDANVQEGLRAAQKAGAQYVVDTKEDLARIQREMGDTFDSTLYVVFEDIQNDALQGVTTMGGELTQIFETARRTLTEIRVSLTKQEAALLSQTPEGAALVQKIGQTETGKPRQYSKSQRSQGGLGSFPGAYEAGYETTVRGEQAFDQGARDAGRVKSPAESSYEVGEAHSEGFNDGAASGIDEAKETGRQTAKKGKARRSTRTVDGTVSTYDKSGNLLSRQTPAQIAQAQATQRAAVAAETFGKKAGSAANRLSNMGGKITGAAFAVSGLVGAFSMVEGPLGDFAAKLFPLVSVVTGLTMAMNAFQASTIATTVAKRAEAAALGYNTATMTASAVAGKGLKGMITKLGGFFRGLGAGIAGLLGPVGLAVAGLTLLAGGIFAVFKIAEAQRQKLENLGDAAQLTAQKLNTIGEITGEDLRTSAFATAPEIAEVGGTEVDQSVVEQLRSSDKFLQDFGTTIEALKDVNQDQGEQILTTLAIQMKAAGSSDETIADVVSALQQEAGRTDLELDFASLDLTEPANMQQQIGKIAAGAQAYQSQIAVAGEKGLGKGASEISQENIQDYNLGGRGAAGTVAMLSSDIAGTVMALEQMRASGAMAVSDVQTEFAKLSSVINNMESPGAKMEVLDQTLEKLELDDALGDIEDVDYAMALVEQRLLGLKIAGEDIELFESASAEDATATQIRLADERLAKIREESGAIAERNAVEAEAVAAQDVRNADVEAALGQIDEEIKALEDQSTAYQILMNAEYSEAEAKQIAGNASYARALAAAAETDAINGTTEASDELLARINALREAGNLPGVEVKGGGGGGGASAVDTSPFDEITKKLRLFSDAQVSVTEGYSDTISEIEKFMSVNEQMSGQFNGLNNQLNDLGLNENLIEMITGMDPDEYEKRKNDLFIFDDQGTIIGMTSKLSSLNDALNTATIGEFITEQNNITTSVGNQITALNRLTNAGASYQAAYRAVQNTALASAIATAKSSREIQAAAEAAMEAQEQMEKFEKINEEEMRKQRIADAVKEQNKQFNNQAKVLDYINKNRAKLTDAQIEAILDDRDLQALLLEPSIAPNALKKALDNANKRAELELKIKKLTIPGQEEIFQEGFDKAMEAFDVQESQIELDFKANMKDEQSILDQAEEEIAKLEFQLDDYEAGLEEIERQEEVINKAYEKRYEALDKVAEANEKITRQQQSQLDIADALSRGDIAAAARAAQEARAAAAEASVEDERARLERSQQAQVAALTSRGGLSREDLQDKVDSIEQKIFRIEEDRLEPAEEAIRLAELQKEKDIEGLKVLGKTREEWEAIEQRLKNAQINNYKFVDSLKEALGIIEELIANLEKGRPELAGAVELVSSGGGTRVKKTTGRADISTGTLETKYVDTEPEELKKLSTNERIVLYKQAQVKVGTASRNLMRASAEDSAMARDEVVRLERIQSRLLEGLMTDGIKLADLDKYTIVSVGEFGSGGQIAKKVTPRPVATRGSGSSAGESRSDRGMSSKEKRIAAAASAITKNSQIKDVRVATSIARADAAKEASLRSRYGLAMGGLVEKYNMGGFVRKSMSGPPSQFARGGLVSNFISTMADGGFAMGSDIVPAMLTPGEFVIRRPAVSEIGIDNLEKLNRGENIGGNMYNYNLNVNVKSDADPNKIARTVMSSIKQVENKRIRGNRF